jgi:hypothetical protein
MKKILLLFLIIIATACEEVVQVDLGTAAPKLVVDALIKWEKGTPGNEQRIRLSMTAPYYSTSVPAVTGASVHITDQAGNVFEFIEESDTGYYSTVDFLPVIGQIYTLTVLWQGKTYTASETLRPVPEITSVEQENDGGFTGDQIEVRAFFEDDAASEDFYLFKFKSSRYAIPTYEVVEDRFFQGNRIFALYSDEDLATNDLLTISICGISQRYFNYMNILTGVAGSNGGSPFQTPPATVRGNVVNASNPQDFALGYFALCQSSTVTYTVQ